MAADPQSATTAHSARARDAARTAQNAATRAVEEEQAFLDLAYAGLEAMRDDANAMLGSVLDLGRGGTFQSRTERDIVVRTSLARLAQLDIGDEALCFGRIDRLADAAGAPDGSGAAPWESFHIGRLAVSGVDHEPLVVDWRAPVAEPFYRATGLDPRGLARRRHLAVRRRRVLGVEDEYFQGAGPGPGPGTDGAEGTAPDGSSPAAGAATEDGASPPGAPGTAGTSPDGTLTADGTLTGDGTLTADGASPEGALEDGLVLGGPGALLMALDRARTGQMGDIVATIQREQDEIIRSPLAGLLMVQGGPGTGKTAVALHRATYLLYTHRFPLERQGVLVVGPNPLFLRYIEQVLPSLGESGVTLSTVSGLVPDVRPKAEEPIELARLKGDVRMARFVARAVRTRQRPLSRGVAVPFGTALLRLSSEDSSAIVARARRRRGTHNARRRFVERLVVDHLAAQLARANGSMAGTAASGEAADDDDTAEGRADLRRQLLRVPELTAALDRMWPRLGADELLHDLFGARPLLAAAGRGLLTEAEWGALYRSRSSSFEAIPWTTADIALIDEAKALLGPRRARSSGQRSGRSANRGSSGPGSSGRRSPPFGAEDDGGLFAAAVAAAAGGADPGAGAEGEDGVRAYGHIVVDEVQDLSPMQLRMLARRSISGSMTVVGDIAQATGPSSPSSWSEVEDHLGRNHNSRRVELTVSYRTPAEVVDVASKVLAIAAPSMAAPVAARRAGVSPRLRRVARADLGRAVADVVADELDAVGDGRTAVLAPDELVGELARAMADRGLSPRDPRVPGGKGLAAPLVLLPASSANGLEFDAVIVVEPALVAAAGAPPALGAAPAGQSAEQAPEPTGRGLRSLYVALTRPTRRLAVVGSLPSPILPGPVPSELV